MIVMNDSYKPKDIEKKWYSEWLANDLFKTTIDEKRKNYCILLPPPNVTGTLHMGHGFQQTIMDILNRYHRMAGYNTLWQPGVDHAGIATQIVIERQLEKDGLTKEKIGREAFIDRALKWKDYSKDIIISQMKELGVSCDWNRLRFTMDVKYSELVENIFIDLYKKGVIYKGKKLVNWDVKRQTAVSDLEVRITEEEGKLWVIKYQLLNSTDIDDVSKQFLSIATTRPETLFGDVAVAVNPNDDRYNKLIGKYILLPIVKKAIPIIADEYVDINFGTGCVKITPAHDFNDYEIGKRHKLEMISIFDMNGSINSNAPLKYQGLNRFVARKEILKDLDSQGLLLEVKNHKLMIPRCERDDEIIEPMLTNQWFMKMDIFKDPALILVKEKYIKFIPENWETVYNHWLNNLQDWCISRQLWWGHRIPAFYDNAGNLIAVGKNKEEIAKTKGLDPDEIYQDNDVLDTWFSSALWPFASLDWDFDEESIFVKSFLPTSVLVTGFDIIFFWVARMIMLTYLYTDKVPFKEINITGLILDAHGNKMSKTKGNVIDPIDLINGIDINALIEKRTFSLINPRTADGIRKQTIKDYPNGFEPFGADALRFTFASIATENREIRFDIKRLHGSKNFCNKIWNAARLVCISLKNHQNLLEDNFDFSKNSIFDNWIISRIQELQIQLYDVLHEKSNSVIKYNFAHSANVLYDFFWHEYCDWYLEFSKINLLSNNEVIQKTTINNLYFTMEKILMILHPFVPFISEEIWYHLALYKKNPVDFLLNKINDHIAIDNINYTSITELKNIIYIIRNARSELTLAPNQIVPILVSTDDKNIKDLFKNYSNYIQNLAKVGTITFVSRLEESNGLVNYNINTKIQLKIHIDRSLEKSRILKELEKHNKEYEKLSTMLNNKDFLTKAPKNLVEKHQSRMKEIKIIIENLRINLNDY